MIKCLVKKFRSQTLNDNEHSSTRKVVVSQNLSTTQEDGKNQPSDGSDSGTESDDEKHDYYFTSMVELDSTSIDTKSLVVSQTSDYCASEQSLCNVSYCADPSVRSLPFSDHESNSWDSVGCESGIVLDCVKNNGRTVEELLYQRNSAFKPVVSRSATAVSGGVIGCATPMQQQQQYATQCSTGIVNNCPPPSHHHQPPYAVVSTQRSKSVGSNVSFGYPSKVNKAVQFHPGYQRFHNHQPPLHDPHSTRVGAWRATGLPPVPCNGSSVHHNHQQSQSASLQHSLSGLTSCTTTTSTDSTSTVSSRGRCGSAAEKRKRPSNSSTRSTVSASAAFQNHFEGATSSAHSDGTFGCAATAPLSRAFGIELTASCCVDFAAQNMQLKKGEISPNRLLTGSCSSVTSSTTSDLGTPTPSKELLMMGRSDCSFSSVDHYAIEEMQASCRQQRSITFDGRELQQQGLSFAGDHFASPLATKMEDGFVIVESPTQPKCNLLDDSGDLEVQQLTTSIVHNEVKDEKPSQLLPHHHSLSSNALLSCDWSSSDLTGDMWKVSPRKRTKAEKLSTNNRNSMVRSSTVMVDSRPNLNFDKMREKMSKSKKHGFCSGKSKFRAFTNHSSVSAARNNTAVMFHSFDASKSPFLDAPVLVRSNSSHEQEMD